MKAAFVFAILLILGASVSARNTILVDDFEPAVQSVQVAINSAGDPNNNGAFQTEQAGFPPILGTQRDVYLTLTAPPFVVATVSVTESRLSGAYAQSSNGIVRVCWDGAADADFSEPDPVPGLGGVDLTISGSFSMLVNITTDHDVEYTFRIYSGASGRSEHLLQVPDVGDDSLPQIFLLTFDSFMGDGSFNSVDAIEMVINFNISGAIDTAVNLITIFEYEVCGTGFLDCNSNTVFDVSEDPFVALTVELLNSQGNVVLDDTVTDNNGDFCFTGLVAGFYQVCSVTPAGVTVTTPTTPTPGCFSIEVTNFEDVLGLEFGFSIGDVVVAPADITIECGDSTFPINTGFATGDSCGTPVITFSDNVGTGCPQVITRTWNNNNNDFDVQFITVDDTTDPTIVTPAADQTDDCTVADMAAWVATNGGATCSDCNSCSFNDNWNGVPPTPCQTIDVIFTAVDPCGNTATTTASYTSNDNGNPTVTLGQPSVTTECNSNGSDVAAYNAWLASFAGATATDNCFNSGSITFSSTGASGLTSTCTNTDSVTFIGTDPCGNQGTAVGQYTISDTLVPVITQAALDSTVACDGNEQTSYTAFVTNNASSGAVDQCSTVLTVTNDAPGQGPTGCDDSQDVTFFYSDACGNAPASTTATFRVVDNAGPQITSPAADLTVVCTGNNQGDYQNWLNTNGGATNTDLCDGGAVAFTNNAPATATDCAGTTVTFTATDSCGLQSSTSADFSIQDNDDPVLTTPAVDETVECDSSATASYNSWVTTRGGFNAVDDCTTVSYTDNAPATATGGCNNVVSVNFIASDTCGNSLVEPATFTIQDNTAPTFTEDPQNDSATCTDNFQSLYQSWLNTNGGAIGSDVCTQTSFTNDGPSTFSFGGCSDTTTVTFYLNDQCGNQDSRTASFTVSDSTAPTVASGAVDQTVVCDGTLNQVPFTNWVNSNGFASFTDDCSVVTVTNNAPASLSGDQCGAGATVTFTGCDPCGRCVTTSGTFTSSDNDAPILIAPSQDLTVQCDGSNNSGDYQNWLNTAGGAQVTDACTPDDADITVTNNAGVIFGCDFVDVTFTFSDPCGNAVTSEATFTAIDNIVPTIDPQAQNLAVECDGSGNLNDYATWVATRAGSSATDACALVLTFSDNSATGQQPTTCPESQTVTFTVEDECGNAASTSATFSIIDTMDPQYSVVPQDQTEVCDRFSTSNIDDFNTWLSSNAGASGFDTCSSVVISHNNPSLISTSQCQADTTVNFVLSDNCGNSVVESAVFSIIDNLPPTVTTQASNLDLECGPTNSASITSWLAQNGGAIAEDSCSIVVTSSNDFGVAPDACVNGDLITFTFADLCGNTATTTALLSIDDAEPPVFTPFPANITVGCDQVTDPSTTGTPTPVDVCDSNPSLTFTDATITLPPESFCPGDAVTVRTWITTDACGNIFTRDQEVTQEFALSTGPCTPSQCPPCEDQQCCEENLEPVPCNPVACTAVDCTSVSCTSVPCNPVNCDGVVNDDGDDDCDPVYIYIFDDDEEFTTDLTGSVQYIPDDDDDNDGAQRQADSPSSGDDDDDSSASLLKVSVAALAVLFLAFF